MPSEEKVLGDILHWRTDKFNFKFSRNSNTRIKERQGFLRVIPYHAALESFRNILNEKGFLYVSISIRETFASQQFGVF